MTYNQAAVDQYVHLFQSIEQSGLIPDLLEEITNNQTQIDNLVSYIELLLNSKKYKVVYRFGTYDKIT